MNEATITTSADSAAGSGSKRLNQVILLGAAVFLLHALFNYSTQTRETKLLLIGDKIPQFSLGLLGGGETSEKDFLGKPMMYVFYAEWCPCSHQTVPWIKKAYENHKADGLNVFFVGIQDTPENLEKFAKLHDLKFPVNINGGQDFSDRVGVSITPTTLFVDGDGVIKSIFVGKVDIYDQLSNGLNSIVPAAGNV